MLNIKIKNPKARQAFIYRFGFEVLGRSIELGITYQEWSNLQQKRQHLHRRLTRFRQKLVNTRRPQTVNTTAAKRTQSEQVSSK